MAISDTNLSNVASVVNKVEQGITSATEAETVVEQAQGVQTLASGFSTIFSLVQQESTSVATKGISKDGSNDFIESMQHSLLSNLGMGMAPTDSLQDGLKSLTSDASIEKLQSAFLVTLQQNLFTVKTTPEQGGENATGVEEVTAQKSEETSGGLELFTFGKNGVDMGDGFDTINVLNHVPVVSEIYKDFAGNEVSLISKLAGGYLYGGPTGLAFSALDMAAESVFDKSLSGLLANYNYAGIFGSNESDLTESSNTTQVTNDREPDATIYWPNTYVPDYKKTASE